MAKAQVFVGTVDEQEWSFTIIMRGYTAARGAARHSSFFRCAPSHKMDSERSLAMLWAVCCSEAVVGEEAHGAVTMPKSIKSVKDIKGGVPHYSVVRIILVTVGSYDHGPMFSGDIPFSSCLK